MTMLASSPIVRNVRNIGSTYFTSGSYGDFTISPELDDYNYAVAYWTRMSPIDDPASTVRSYYVHFTSNSNLRCTRDASSGNSFDREIFVVEFWPRAVRQIIRSYGTLLASNHQQDFTISPTIRNKDRCLVFCNGDYVGSNTQTNSYTGVVAAFLISDTQIRCQRYTTGNNNTHQIHYQIVELV